MTEKGYKQFLLQRSVLDTLRVYLDMTESFLEQMTEYSILSQDDVSFVQVREMTISFVPLDMKECICHFSKWQIHPSISKGI